MLTIPTFIDRSIISGIGVFSSTNIRKDTVIWIYNACVDLTYTQENWELLKNQVNPFSFNRIENYSYKENGSYILCTDNAQFMNHDEVNFNVCNSSDLLIMFASRDIYEGEELLCNYHEYSDQDDHHVLYLKELKA